MSSVDWFAGVIMMSEGVSTLVLTNRVNSTCVLAVRASWSARMYAATREMHGWVCPLCYLLLVTRSRSKHEAEEAKSIERGRA